MNFYLDESIRDHGRFVIGAVVGSDADLTEVVRAKWIQLGFDPDQFEYKSRALKCSNLQQVNLREQINSILQKHAKLALVVVPLEQKNELGSNCVRLMEQLKDKGHLKDNIEHYLYADKEIYFSFDHIQRLKSINVETIASCDSVAVAGIQVADHAAHILGSMLMEDLGLLNKHVASPYPPEYQVESVTLGWELWAGIRPKFISQTEYDLDDAESLPYAIVEGHGLAVADECHDALKKSAVRTFGKSYLGCTV